MDAPEREEEPKTSAADWARHWALEFAAAREFVKPWHNQAKAAVKAFEDDKEHKSEKHWPLFTANIQTLEAMMYANPPKVEVTRAYADAKDDVARVSALLLERHLNADVERTDDGYCTALGQVLWDRLVPGGGFVWTRYVREEEDTPEVPPQRDEAGNELAPAVPPGKKLVREDVETDWCHWERVLWSAGARVYHEARWWARAADMAREALVKRFGELGKQVPLNAKAKKEEGEGMKDPPWARAEVWEIWDKENKKVFWYVEGFGRVLDTKDDPYELTSFFPSPRPWFANTTTSKYRPKPDYHYAKDVYDDINTVTTRIDRLQRALKVAGVYDQTNTGLQSLLSEGVDNKLVPVQNFAALSEKGGLKGAIDWMPLDQIIQALLGLRDYRRELLEAHDQLTGKSDLMRGQATQANETATSARIRGRYGSVRLNRLQDEFARLASDVQRIRAELICKLFDPQTILERANAQFMDEDPQVVQQAVELLKTPGEFPAYRITVKSESLAYADFDAQKAEAMEVLTGVSQYLSVAGPLMQQTPAAGPFLLQLLQASLARLKGGAVFEGIIDKAIQTSEQAAQQPQQAQPDPKLQVQQLKGQQDQQKIQAELQADLIRTQAEVQADERREQTQALYNSREAMVRHQLSEASKATDPKPAGGPRP